jgi:hemerythrin-like domain-containing protein
VAAFKNLFSFLFQRSSAEERVAMYVVREHERGRALSEVLEDRYVQNRLTPEQQKRLLDRPEIVEAISGDILEATKASIEPGATT